MKPAACRGLCFGLAFLTACGGGGSHKVETTPIVVSITSPSAFVVASGQLQFQCTVENTADKAVAWQVNNVTGGNAAVGTISSSGLYTAPVSPIDVTVRAVSHADNSKTSSSKVTVLPPHRIGVRTTDSGFVEFYDRTLGTTFEPRGNNYIRLADLTLADGGSGYGHSTFNVGVYDPARSESALAAMQSSGYNSVRVFLNGCCQNTIGDPAGGLRSAYIDNLIDFLGRARKHGIYVIFTQDYLSDFGGYNERMAGCSQFSDFNMLNLCAGGIDATKAFFHDLAVALVKQGAPMDAILAYELRNEYFYETDQPPLSWTSGTVTTADGNNYDMADPDSRQQMMDNGLTYFADQARSAIVAVDPTALVTVGFFWPQTPNPTRIGDPRWINVYPAIANSSVDFVDIHTYAIPGELTLPQMLENFGITGYQQQKPVLVAEFGAFKDHYPDVHVASSILSGWQQEACPYSIRGWLLWTWDTEEPEQVPPLWAATSGDGSINQALSPATHPDICP